LTRDDLERWWTHGDPADRDRIVTHLAECDACIQSYGALMDTREAELPPVTPPATAAAIGRRVPVDAHDSTARRSWHPWQFAGVGAAAALVIAFVFVTGRPSQSPAPDDSAIRSSRLTLLAPIGAVTLPTELRWVSPVAAPRFRVQLIAANGRELHTATVEAERLPLPEDVRQRLEPGQEYRWHVTALDAEGQQMMRSEPGAFVIAGK
jgi:hypothetical protein